MKRKNHFRKFVGIFIAFILGIISGNYQQNPSYFATLYNYLPNKSRPVQLEKNSSYPNISPNISQIARSKVSTCFTPPAGCAKFIANEVDKAEESIYMQAYGMSDTLITEALINAQSRGVKVKILLDRSNISQKFSKMHKLQRAKIDVSIDKVPGIAHNKVIIIDKKKVITGSFNFTKAADTRNAENVIVIEDKSLADSYLQNWLSRKAHNY
jgi:phospholipase D